MTENKLKKKDLNVLFNKIDPKNIDKDTLLTIQYILNNEVQCSVVNNGTDKHLTQRNILCFDNMLKYLNENNLSNAWWEFFDIISYSDNDEYISIDEAVLLNIAIKFIIEKI